MTTRQKMKQPPKWFGAIFVAAGLLPLFFGKPSPGVPPWVAQTSAFIFIFAGIGLIFQSYGNMERSNIAWVMMVLAFLTVFNWVGFGPGERMGTSSVGMGGVTTSNSKADVRIPFAFAAGIMDVIALLCIFNMFKRK